MRLIYAILFFTAFIFQAKAEEYPPRQLLKFTTYPEFFSYRFQYEYAPKKFYSFGVSAFYSPNGTWGNYKDSKWIGISPMVRGYAGSSRAKGFYLEASLPAIYKENYPLNYGLLSISPSIIGNNVYGYDYKAEIKKTFTTIGGGLAVGAQFKLYRRFYMDIAMVYEKYIKPGSVDKEITLYENRGGNIYEEKVMLDETWNYINGRIYIGYQLFKD